MPAKLRESRGDLARLDVDRSPGEAAAMAERAGLPFAGGRLWCDRRAGRRLAIPALALELFQLAQKEGWISCPVGHGFFEEVVDDLRELVRILGASLVQPIPLELSKPSDLGGLYQLPFDP